MHDAASPFIKKHKFKLCVLQQSDWIRCMAQYILVQAWDFKAERCDD